MSKMVLNSHNYVTRIRDILHSARTQSLRAVNSTMVAAYWYIGREIVEEEQHGKKRADYGKKILLLLADKLIHEFGKGFSVSTLKLIQDRESAIQQTVISKLAQLSESTSKKTIGYSLSSQSEKPFPSVEELTEELKCERAAIEGRLSIEAKGRNHGVK